MDDCFQDYFVYNGEPLGKEKFFAPPVYEAIIYEVIRIIDGIPVFLNDHTNRLMQSVSNKFPNLSNYIKRGEIEKDILLLVKKNSSPDGNVKYAIYINGEQTYKFVYYITHRYPDLQMIKNGVVLETLQAKRTDPNTKIVHNGLKEMIDKLLSNKEIFEILLLDEDNNIMEGSRSNIFFIRNNTLFTAPDERVLKGITRQYAIFVAAKNKIPVDYNSINKNDLLHVDGAFLTGTSPKILPICAIDSFKFETLHPITQTIINDYNSLINKYVQQHKSD